MKAIPSRYNNMHAIRWSDLDRPMYARVFANADLRLALHVLPKRISYTFVNTWLGK